MFCIIISIFRNIVVLNPFLQSPQKHSILLEVPPERNAIGDDNGTGKLNKDDQNANPVSTLEDSDDDEPVFRTKSHKKVSQTTLWVIQSADYCWY